MNQIYNMKMNKSFCGGLFAKRKAQGAKRIIQLTLCAKRQALCAFPLAAGGKTNFTALVLGLIILLAAAVPGFLSSQEPPSAAPFQKLKQGDWWTVKVEQMPIWKRAAQSSWVDVGEWKFQVRSKEDQKLIVDVSNLNRPKDAQRWELILVYNTFGMVIDATYTIGDRTFTGDAALELIPLGKEGLSIGVSMDKIKKSPMMAMGFDVQTNQQIEMAKVDLKDIGAYQLWRPEEVWWRYFKREKGLPIRAELKKTSWWKIEIDKKVKFKEKKE
jgi:hypothetical protein